MVGVNIDQHELIYQSFETMSTVVCAQIREPNTRLTSQPAAELRTCRQSRTPPDPANDLTEIEAQ